LLTHRQTNKLWQKHNLFGGGNNAIFWSLCSSNYAGMLFYKSDAKCNEALDVGLR